MSDILMFFVEYLKKIYDKEKVKKLKKNGWIKEKK